MMQVMQEGAWDLSKGEPFSAQSIVLSQTNTKKESLRVFITTLLMEILMELQLQRLSFPTRLVIMLSYSLNFLSLTFFGGLNFTYVASCQMGSGVSFRLDKAA